MNTIFNRIAAGTVLAAAPVLIALGTAAAGHAETTDTNQGPTISRPIPHQLFPTQDFVVPGNWSHHHHQWHRGW